MVQVYLYINGEPDDASIYFRKCVLISNGTFRSRMLSIHSDFNNPQTEVQIGWF